MAIMSIVLAPGVGKLTDRVHPRQITAVGFTAVIVSLVWLSRVMTPGSATWEILLPMALLGIGNAGVWAPTSATANRNLPMNLAGAGAGVYNATRQVGAVLGSAAIAVLMDSRLAAHHLNFSPSEAGKVTKLPAVAAGPFASAMSDAILLPAGVLVLGFLAVLFYATPRHQLRPAAPAEQPIVEEAVAQPSA
jgi:MFS family permease